MAPVTSSEFRATDLSAGRRWGVLGLLFAASLINYLDRATISFALPLMSDDLGFGPMQKGVLLSAFFYSYAYMQVPIGWVADRVSLKWVYAVMFALWSLACGLVGLATSLAMVIVLRILLGFGESIYLPGGMKIVSQLFPPRQRGLPSGLFDFGTRGGLVLGSFLIPYLIVHFGWRPMFMIVGFSALLWLPPWLSVFPSKELNSQTALNGRKSATWTVLLYPFLLLLAPLWFLIGSILPGQRTRSSSSPVWGPMLQFLEMLRNRNLFGIILGFFCFDYYFYVLLTWLPDYLVKGRAIPIEKAGYIVAVVYIVAGFAEPVGGWLADSLISRGWNETRTRKGLVVVGWATGLFLIPAGFASNNWTILTCLVGASLVGLSTGNLLAILQSCAPPDKVGMWTGVMNYSGNLAGIIAPLVMAYFLKITGAYGYGFAIGAVILIIGLIPYVFVVQELSPPKGTHEQEG